MSVFKDVEPCIGNARLVRRFLETVEEKYGKPTVAIFLQEFLSHLNKKKPLQEFPLEPQLSELLRRKDVVGTDPDVLRYITADEQIKEANAAIEKLRHQKGVMTGVTVAGIASGGLGFIGLLHALGAENAQNSLSAMLVQIGASLVLLTGGVIASAVGIFANSDLNTKIAKTGAARSDAMRVLARDDMQGNALEKILKARLLEGMWGALHRATRPIDVPGDERAGKS